MMWTREMAMRKDTHRISKAHAKRTYQPKLQPRACFATFVLMHILLFARGYAFSSQLQSLLTNGSFEEERVEWAPTTTTQRVEYPQAHSGRYCMRGEVTRPNQARFLNYAVDFNPDALYKVSLWAKSSNRNKLVLWIKIGDERRMVAVWTRTARAWRRYETAFSPPRAGKGEIQIIAPSSFGGPVGIMWVDDVQITVQPMPPNFRLTDGISINDYPTATLDGSGNLWIAWLHFSCAPDSHKNFEVRHPSEALHVACMPSDEIKRLIAGKSTSNVARRRARIALPSNVWVRDLHLVSLPSGTLLLYSMERGDNWDICAVQLNEDGATIKASEPTRLTVDSSTDIKPVGAVAPDDSLWLAWESNRGGARSIYVRQFDARTLKPISAVVRASRPDNNCYNPSIAIVAPSQDAGYEVWIVWDSFRNGTYDIYARVFDGRKWRSEMQLTNESPFNRHPIICASKDSVWIAWERGYVPRYHIGRYDQKQIHVAKFTGESLLAPNGLFNTPLMNWCEAPALAIDPAGRIWVIGRRSRGQHGAWDAVALCYSGAKWSKPIVLTARTGRARRIPIIATANGIVALVQIDNMPRTWSGRNLTAEWHSDIYACTVAYTEAPSPAPMTLMRWRPPSMPEVIVGNLFKQFNELAPRHSITYNGKRLFLFWGQFHEHSDVSICNRRGDLPPEDNYAHERDIARLDFAAVTDHGYNFDPYIWHTMAKIVRSNNDPGRFVTFLGEEWTSDQVRDKSGLGHYGHRNLIFANPRFPRWFNSRDMSKPTDIWAKLRGINFIHIPHQLADTGNCPTDWRYVDEVAQPVAEIFQVRGSYEYEGAPRQAKRTISGHFIQDAWAQGVIIGVIASPDHGGGYGKAGVYAPSLTREAILDAIRQRHTYGTTAAKIVLEMRVNGHLMGEKIKLNAPPKSVKVQVHAIGARDIARVDVCRNNVFIYTRRPNAREVNFIFEDKAPLQSRAYYYVRIIQADEEIAWSSPVWLLP